MIRYLSFILLLILFSLLSCRKDADDNVPSIEILSPSEFSNFSVGDIIAVEINASDDQKLEYVKIDITSLSQSPILPPVQYSNFSGTSDSRTVGIELNDASIPSDSYLIRAVVSDGRNERVAFREISINELPLDLERLYVFTAQGANNIAIDSLDRESDSWINAGGFPISYGGHASFSNTQRLVIYDDNTSEILFAAAINPELEQSYSFPNGGISQYWRGSSSFGDTFLSGSADGLVRTWTSNGILNNSFNIQDGFLPGVVFLSEQYIFVELESIATGIAQLATYFRGSGAFFQSDVLEFDLVSIINRNENELLLFGNDENGNGEVRIFNIAQNGYGVPLPLAKVNEMRTAIALPGNEYCIIDEDGIRSFILSSSGELNSQMTSPSPGNFTQASLDRLQGGVYLLDENTNEMKLFNRQLGSSLNNFILESIPLPADAEGFALVYNR